MSYASQQRKKAEKYERIPTIELIGSNVVSSLSPAIMNHGFRLLGLDLEQFWYGTRQIPYIRNEAKRLEGLKGLLANRLCAGMKGLAVTVPYKTDVLKTGTVVPGNKQAHSTGAVNTLLPAGDKWIGYNTDCQGVRGALTMRKVNPAEGPTVVIGAGATAASACVALAQMGATEIVIANRHVERAKGLAARLQENWPGMQVQAAVLDTDPGGSLAKQCRLARLIINTTPAGQAGTAHHGQNPLGSIDISGGSRKQSLMDVIYDPLITPFLEQGMQAGRQPVYGLDMLAHQAAAQLPLFAGCALGDMGTGFTAQQLLAAGHQERLRRAT